MKEEKILMVCTCTDPSHQMIFSYFPSSEDHYVWCEVLLNKNCNVFRRIVNAVKYICHPAECNYGNFNEILLSQEHIAPLEKIISQLKAEEVPATLQI